MTVLGTRFYLKDGERLIHFMCGFCYRELNPYDQETHVCLNSSKNPVGLLMDRTFQRDHDIVQIFYRPGNGNPHFWFRPRSVVGSSKLAIPHQHPKSRLSQN